MIEFILDCAISTSIPFTSIGNSVLAFVILLEDLLLIVRFLKELEGEFSNVPGGRGERSSKELSIISSGKNLRVGLISKVPST